MKAVPLSLGLSKATREIDLLLHYTRNMQPAEEAPLMLDTCSIWQIQLAANIQLRTGQASS